MNYLKILKIAWQLLPLLLIVGLIIVFRCYKNEKQKINDYKEVNATQYQEIEIWKDKAGKNRARAEIAEISAKNAKLVLNEELRKMLKKEVGNLKRNLISYSAVKSSTQGTIKAQGRDTIFMVNKLQSLPARKFNINNPDLTFEGLYVPELDSLLVDYKVIHDFDMFYYYKKPGKSPWNLFRRKRAVAEIKFHNHGSQADSLFTVVLERKKGLLKRALRR